MDLIKTFMLYAEVFFVLAGALLLLVGYVTAKDIASFISGDIHAKNIVGLGLMVVGAFLVIGSLNSFSKRNSQTTIHVPESITIQQE